MAAERRADEACALTPEEGASRASCARARGRGVDEARCRKMTTTTTTRTRAHGKKANGLGKIRGARSMDARRGERRWRVVMARCVRLASWDVGARASIDGAMERLTTGFDERARTDARAASDALYELTRLAGLDVRREVHDAVLELSRARVVPTAVAQVLRSLASKASDARASGLREALAER
jgi:hypothetical protein